LANKGDSGPKISSRRQWRHACDTYRRHPTGRSPRSASHRVGPSPAIEVFEQLPPLSPRIGVSPASQPRAPTVCHMATDTGDRSLERGGAEKRQCALGGLAVVANRTRVHTMFTFGSLKSSARPEPARRGDHTAATPQKLRNRSAGETARATAILIRLIAEAFCLPFSTATMKVRFTPQRSANRCCVRPFVVRISRTASPRSVSGAAVGGSERRLRDLGIHEMIGGATRNGDHLMLFVCL
jgi:hypothetical protein